MTSPFRVFIGWDQREPIAYDVAKYSLERRASISVAVTPIKLDELRAKGLYWRDIDPKASTEFTYSRFLTPALAGFSGWALFCDCDFLWLGDIAGLANYAQGARRSIASSMIIRRRRRPRWMAQCRPSIRARTGRR